jgi:flagellin
MFAQENLRVNGNFQAQTILRLTSGYRINQSGDDAAGLGVANAYRSSIAELTQGVRNANDAVSQLQIIDGGLNNISKMLDRMKTLATEAASETFTGDRVAMDAEYSGVKAEIDREASNVGLNVGGNWAKSLSVYIGGTTPTETVDLSAGAVDSATLGTAAGIDTATNATTAIGQIDTALANLSTVQGAVGSGQNKLSYATDLANSQITNYSAAQSRIRDADMASEAANLTKAQVLQQASIAAMAQANSAPQAILSLLK